jgi:hypothetical protein
MKKNWIGAIIGDSPKPFAASQAVAESLRNRSTMSRVLGEAAPLPPEAGEVDAPEVPDAPDAPAAPAEPADQAPGSDFEDVQPSAPAASSVEALVSAWESGSRVSVAQTLLGGISSYTDLVGLLYGIGPDGAQELARLMDELSSDEPEGAQETDDLPPAEDLETPLPPPNER